MAVPKKQFQLNLNRNFGNYTVEAPYLTGAQTAIQFKDEGINVEALGTVGIVNFAGLGVTATAPGASTVLLTIPGASELPYVAKTADYTITTADGTVDCTENSFTATLLTAVGIAKRIFNIKASGAGVITVVTTLNELIDGMKGIIKLYEGDNLQIQSTGTGWIIL